MKLIITGGVTGKYSRVREFFGKEREITEGCVDILDVSSGKVEPLLRIQVPDLYRDVSYKRDFRLTSASIHDGILYIASPTRVLLYNWPSLTPIREVNSNLFNDVHHVTVIKGKIYVVSTGLDAVLRFSMEGEFEEITSVVLEDIKQKFDLNTDYRLIGSLKPHASHPNFVFEMADGIWCTRFKQKDVINIKNRETIHLYDRAGMHDGFSFENKIYFTTVDGHIIELDATEKRVTNIVDINAIDGRGIPLGWCRGLFVDKDFYYVGFSLLRTTKLIENLYWLKNTVKGEMPEKILPSRIIKIDRAKNKIVQEFEMKYPSLDMIFSILNG